MAMERPKLTQGHLNRLPRKEDLPDIPCVQWRVENREEIARFLEAYEVRIVDVPGNQLVIQTPIINSDIQLSPGDYLVLEQNGERERLGVVRVRDSVPFREADGLKDHDNPHFMDPRDKKITYGY